MEWELNAAVLLVLPLIEDPKSEIERCYHLQTDLSSGRVAAEPQLPGPQPPEPQAEAQVVDVKSQIDHKARPGFS